MIQMSSNRLNYFRVAGDAEGRIWTSVSVGRAILPRGVKKTRPLERIAQLRAIIGRYFLVAVNSGIFRYPTAIVLFA
jgi:hypothetical protein